MTLVSGKACRGGLRRTVGLGHAGQEQCDFGDVHPDEILSWRLGLGWIGSRYTTDEKV